MPRRRPIQLELPVRRWGGARAGAGRKKRSSETVPHARRSSFGEKHPLHVTLRVRREIWNLRSQRAFRVVERALRVEQERGVVRVVHYSVQGNHLHLVVEAPDAPSLSRRMQGFAIRLAKGLNAMMSRRRGKVFAERYHARVLRTPTEVRNVLAYVLGNREKHVGGAAIDPYSSGPWFEGWSRPVPSSLRTPCTGPPPIASPVSWLLTRGWKRLGQIDPRTPPPSRPAP